MSALSGLSVALAVAIVLGLFLYLAIRSPLQNMLRNNCAGDDTVAFWSRFTLIMLFLGPAFLSLSAGLPPAELIPKTDPAALFVRVSTASLVGSFLAMICMGLWVSSLAKRFSQSSNLR
jgi:hypothetical protein